MGEGGERRGHVGERPARVGSQKGSRDKESAKLLRLVESGDTVLSVNK